jgi:salicylate hydroxylase
MEESWYATGSHEEALSDFRRSHVTITRIIEAAGRLGLWPLYDRAPLATWSSGRVGLIGDACHPMLPFMAQGAVQAIEDAYILAREVSSAENPAHGFARYQSLRLPRTARIQALSARNARLYHRTNPVTQLGTFGPMWLGGRLAPEIIRQQMDWIYSYDATQ